MRLRHLNGKAAFLTYVWPNHTFLSGSRLGSGIGEQPYTGTSHGVSPGTQVPYEENTYDDTG